MACRELAVGWKVAVYLQHPAVEAWTFLPRNGERFLAACPGARLVACADEAQFKAALAEAEVAVVWEFRQEWFALAPKLKWLATPAAGKEFFKQLQPPDGVKLLHGSFHGELIGETVAGLLLGHCRGLFAAARLQHLSWPRAELAEGMVPLRGSHVVILGFGSIGRWIGRLVKPFGVRITGIRKHLPAGLGGMATGEAYLDAEDRVLPLSALDAVLSEADHLVMALPGGAETDQLMDARRLGLLRPKAALYNIGRGNAVDEGALAAALRSEKLAAAYLDVFAHEPLPADSPLRNCPGAFLLPHVSAVAPNYLDLFMAELAEKITAQ